MGHLKIFFSRTTGPEKIKKTAWKCRCRFLKIMAPWVRWGFLDHIEFEIRTSNCILKKSKQMRLVTMHGALFLKLDTNSIWTTQLYDKRDDFNFSTVNFLYLHVCSNIQILPAYSVNISQLIRYAN
jgi:hypothetical protein